jgi:hypothetical protein
VPLKENNKEYSFKLIMQLTRVEYRNMIGIVDDHIQLAELDPEVSRSK